MDIYFSSSQRQKSHKIKRIKIYCWLGVLGLIIIFGIYAITESQIFKVRLEIIGLKRLSEPELLQSSAGLIFKNSGARFLGLNNYLAWPKKLQLNEPLVANLTIQKNLLEKKIVLTVEERQPYGIWCINNSQCAWFDKNGIIFEEAPVSEGHLILKINSDAENLPMLGQTVIGRDLYLTIQKIISFFDVLDLKIENYELKNELQEFHVQIFQGPKIFFGLRFDPKNNLDALDILIKKNGSLKNIDYIDLTVENRIYLKPY